MVFLGTDRFLHIFKKILALVSFIYRGTVNALKKRDQFCSIRGVFPFGDVWFFKSAKSTNEYLTIISQYALGLGKIFQNEKAFEVKLGLKRVIIFNSSEAAQVLLSSKTQLKKNFAYDTLKICMREGLITNSDAKRWKLHRKTLNPSFHHQLLKRYQSIMSHGTRQLCDLLKSKSDGTPFEIYPYILKESFSSVFEASTASISNYKWKVHIYKCAKRMTEIVVERALKNHYLINAIFYLSALGKESLRVRKDVHTAAGEVLKERHLAVKRRLSTTMDEWNANADRPCLVDSLIEHQLSNEDSFSDGEICDEIVTMIAAGFETTAVGLNWCILLIGNHPEVQSKIHEELDAIFGTDRDQEITQSDVMRMKYLNCVVKEVLRLYPPVRIIFRKLTEDLFLDGRCIPGGTDVAVNIAAIHMNPKYFEQPERFEPERFLPENASKIHPYAYIPFSSGPRNCIASAYAAQFMVTLTAAILRRFTIEAVEKPDKIAVLLATTGKPSKPILVKMNPRNHKSIH